MPTTTRCANSMNRICGQSITQVVVAHKACSWRGTHLAEWPTICGPQNGPQSQFMDEHTHMAMDRPQNLFMEFTRLVVDSREKLFVDEHTPGRRCLPWTTWRPRNHWDPAHLARTCHPILMLLKHVFVVNTKQLAHLPPKKSSWEGHTPGRGCLPWTT